MSIKQAIKTQCIADLKGLNCSFFSFTHMSQLLISRVFNKPIRCTCSVLTMRLIRLKKPHLHFFSLYGLQQNTKPLFLHTENFNLPIFRPCVTCNQADGGLRGVGRRDVRGRRNLAVALDVGQHGVVYLEGGVTQHTQLSNHYDHGEIL